MEERKAGAYTEEIPFTLSPFSPYSSDRIGHFLFDILRFATGSSDKVIQNGDKNENV